MTEKIGEFSETVIRTLNLDIPVGTDILLSSQTLEHINNSHPEQGLNQSTITEILKEPDYIGYSPRKNTVDFIRADDIRISVPVRPSSDGKYFVRTAFYLHKKDFERLKRSNSILPLDK